MKYVVDVQGFKVTCNEFVFKEVAIAPLEEDATPSVFLFKPPYPWPQLVEKNKSENRWLEQNFHGLSWSSGEIPYKELSSTLHAILDDADVYVKGLEKSKWLKRLLPDEKVHNVEVLGCPSLKSLPSLPVKCTNHRKPHLYPVCAVQNVYAILKWMLSEGYQEAEENSHLNSMFN